MGRGSFAEIDHTADLGLELTGPDPAAVLEAAQRGLVSALFGEIPRAEPSETREVALSEASWPDLLKTWCERLYSWLEDDGFVPLESRVEALSPDRVDAEIRGAVLDREALARASELKAVTYHQLAFEREGGEWRARVIFDV